jgi:glutathione S-transferase
VLQYLADRKPEAGLAPAWGSLERYQLIDTLNYLSTEVHKRIFANVFNPKAAEPTKEAARKLFEPTLDYLARRLGSGEFLVGSKFTVADAYLVTLLNWFVFLNVDLEKWPTIAAYHARHLARPAVAQAMGVEMAERKRRAA